MIIDADGYILTNEHVVARASRVRVTLADERSFQARIVGADLDHDLAVLKVDSDSPLPFLEIGTSNDILAGEKAGLRSGDIILRVGKEPVASVGEYLFRVGHYSSGDLVPLGVRRGNRDVDFIVRAETPSREILDRPGVGVAGGGSGGGPVRSGSTAGQEGKPGGGDGPGPGRPYSRDGGGNSERAG